MGTDRSNEFEGPCICGRGTFRIDYCEVDHPWPTSTPQWYESRIHCPECSERFSLQERENQFILIEQSVLRERQQRAQFANERADAILSDEEVKSVINRFERLLNAQRSVAAIYRLLKNAGLEHCSEGTFRRHWTTSDSWVKSWARPHALMQIFQVVGAQTVQLSAMLSELHALEEYASQPPEPYGDPVYVIGA